MLFAGSVVGLKGNAGQCAYSAAKSGLEGFTRSLAKEVASRRVRVNLVAPGTTPPPRSTALFSAQRGPLPDLRRVLVAFPQVSFAPT